MVWSPGNVCFNRDGAVVAQNSTYLKAGFTGTSFALIIDVCCYRRHLIPSEGWGQWIVSVDGSAPTPVIVPEPPDGSDLTTVHLARGLAAGRHNLQAWFNLRDETDTYTPKNAQEIKSIVLDDGAVLEAPSGPCAVLPRAMMIMGDSITNGYKSTDPSGASNSESYPLTNFAVTLGQALHCEYGIVAASGQGWAHNYNAWNEFFPSAFGNYFAGRPRVWPTLEFLVVAEGTNDTGDITETVQAWLPLARAAVGGETWIILVVPFSGRYASQLHTAAAEYGASSGDIRVAVVEPSTVLSLGQSGTFFTTDGVHPQPLMQPLYGAILASQIRQVTSGVPSR